MRTNEIILRILIKNFYQDLLLSIFFVLSKIYFYVFILVDIRFLWSQILTFVAVVILVKYIILIV